LLCMDCDDTGNVNSLAAAFHYLGAEKAVLSAALARERRVSGALIEDRMVCASADTEPRLQGCPPSRRAPADLCGNSDSRCPACWRKWGEVQADKATNAAKPQGGK